MKQYIFLYPSYKLAREAFKNMLQDFIDRDIQCKGEHTNLLITTTLFQYRFISIPINIDLSHIMGLVGECTDMGVSEYLEECKGSLNREITLMRARKIK